MLESRTESALSAHNGPLTRRIAVCGHPLAMLKYIIILGATLALIVLLVAGFMTYRTRQGEALLYQTAVILGYQPEREIVRFQNCWDLGAHCGTYLIFATSADRSSYADAIQRLGQRQTFSGEADPGALITHVNLRTARRFAINGSTETRTASFLSYPAHMWVFEPASTGTLHVYLYELTASSLDVALDGQPFTDNVAVVMLQTR